MKRVVVKLLWKRTGHNIPFDAKRQKCPCPVRKPSKDMV